MTKYDKGTEYFKICDNLPSYDSQKLHKQYLFLHTNVNCYTLAQIQTNFWPHHPMFLNKDG